MEPMGTSGINSINKFYGRTMPVRPSQFGIAGKERNSKCLGECNVGTVVGGHHITQLPDSLQQWLVGVPFNEHLGQILKRLLGARCINLLPQGESS